MVDVLLIYVSILWNSLVKLKRDKRQKIDVGRF